MATKPLMPGEDGAHPTFCRICEAFCGLVVNVEGGRAVSVQPDKDNPHSQGHVCVKGVASAQLPYDPDRITSPMRRVGSDLFETVTWDEALDDIAARLLAIREKHGDEALASYAGNPSAFSTDLLAGHNAFMNAIGGSKFYGAGSQDSNSRMVANYILYGSPGLVPFPDLPQL